MVISQSTAFGGVLKIDDLPDVYCVLDVETLFRLFLGCCQVAYAVWMTSPVVTWHLLAYEVSEAGGGGFVPCLCVWRCVSILAFVWLF